MNKLLAFTVPIGLLLVACGGQKPPEPGECKVISIPARCVSMATYTISTMGHTVTPPHYCAPPGDITINIQPPHSDAGSVITKPKNPALPNVDWLNGTNAPDGSILVLKPGDAPNGGYNYFVYFADGSCIDPKITI